MQQATLNAGKKKIFDALTKASRELNLEIMEESPADSKLRLAHNGNISSFGNIIEVSIKNKATNKNVIHVSSRSAAQIQLVDWGTNQKLESDLIDSVKTNLGL